MKQIHLDILNTLSVEDPETAKYFNSSLCVKQRYFWTLQNCIKDALKYKTRGQWRKNSKSAYNRATKKGWLSQCCKHMGKKQIKPRGHWDIFENCKNDALNYNTRKDWESSSGSACNSARRNGWLNECCAHMKKRQIKPRGYWTLETVKEEALKYNTRNQWRITSSHTYHRACKNGWLDICCKHMIKG